MRTLFKLGLVGAVAVAMAGCNDLPGRPAPLTHFLKTNRYAAFSKLYSQNCAACHGEDGKGGAAVALANPVYLAIADNAVLKKATSNGMPGTPMPAFAESAGGTLDTQQINTLVKGIRQWEKPSDLAGVKIPPYAPDLKGNPKQGAQVYQTFCSSCHGLNGVGGRKAGSVVDPTFLSLVSNQNLRTVVIAGMPNLGAPDWRNDVPGKPMTDQQITDVVSWLASHRVKYPGQPYPENGGDGTKDGNSE